VANWNFCRIKGEVCPGVTLVCKLDAHQQNLSGLSFFKSRYIPLRVDWRDASDSFDQWTIQGFVIEKPMSKAVQEFSYCISCFLHYTAPKLWFRNLSSGKCNWIEILYMNWSFKIFRRDTISFFIVYKTGYLSGIQYREQNDNMAFLKPSVSSRFMVSA